MPGKHTAKEKRKARHVYNVRDFGAVGDGVTDDRVSIQSAIDACVTANGGVADSERRGGASVATAKRVAWATVNKRRNPSVNPELEADIIAGMARYLWVSAVADYTQEHGENPAVKPKGVWGEIKDWNAHVSDTPAAANRAARELAGLYAANEGFQADDVMVHLFELAAHVDIGQPIDMDPSAPYNQPEAAELQRRIDSVKAQGVRSKHNREQLQGRLESLGTVSDMAMGFGADMAAEALGAGVAWSDDHTVKRDGMVFDPKTPSFECHYDGENLTWSGSAVDGKARTSGHEHTRTPRVEWTTREVLNEDTDDEEVVERPGDGESLRPTQEEAELGIAIVDKAVAFMHAQSEKAQHEIEPSFHGSPHTLEQGPERRLFYVISGDAFPAGPDATYGSSRTEWVFAFVGVTWEEQRAIFNRIYREQWEPRPTQIGGITVVNPDDIDIWDRRYVLQFSTGGMATARWLMAYADSEDAAFDLCVDWLEEQGLEGYFEDEQVAEDETLAANMITGGNHGHYIDPQNFAIVARNPTANELRQLGRNAL